jgi:hypothetical protein
MDLRLLALVCLLPACVVDDGPSTTLEPTPSSTSTATTSAGESTTDDGTSSGAETSSGDSSSSSTTTVGAEPAYGEPYSDCTATNDCPDPLVCDVREVLTEKGTKTIHQCLALCQDISGAASDCPPAPGDQPVTCSGYCYLSCEPFDPGDPQPDSCPFGMECNASAFCSPK